MNAFHIAHVARIVGAAIAMMSALLIGPAGSPPAHADPCPNVEVVFARGTSQQPGVGNVGQAFIDSLRSQIGGRSLGVYAVNYPGTFQFAQSAPIGANDVTGHVQDMVGRCPNTKLVLGGMSQGAGVIDMASTMIPPKRPITSRRSRSLAIRRACLRLPYRAASPTSVRFSPRKPLTCALPTTRHVPVA